MACSLKHTAKKHKAQKPLPEEDRDPRAVFIGNLHFKVTAKQLEEKLSQFVRIKDVNLKLTSGGKSKGFAFATLYTEEDAQRLINMPKKPMFKGKRIAIKTARKQNVRPFNIDYSKKSFSELEYDLSPVDPSKISIHMLDDDTLLNIFTYLPMKKLIQSEIVCRRWQSFVHKEVSIRFKNSKHYLFESLNMFDIHPSIPSVSKILIIIGEEITKLYRFNIQKFFGKGSKEGGQISVMIGHLCPNLEEIHLGGDWNLIWLSNILKKCKKVRNIGLCQQKKMLKREPLQTAITMLANRLNELTVCSEAPISLLGINFSEVQKSLEKLSLFGSILDNVFLTCVGDDFPNLRSLIIDSGITPEMLIDIGRKIPHIEELSLSTNLNMDYSSLNKYYTNLRIIHVFGNGKPLSLQGIIDAFPNLEELHLKSMVWMRDPECSIDFSKLTNLRKLALPKVTTYKYDEDLNKSTMEENAFAVKSLQSLEKCIKLEILIYMGVDLEENWFFGLIAACPLLKEIHLPRLSMVLNDASKFISVNSSGRGSIKLVLCHELNNCPEIIYQNLRAAHYKVEERIGPLFDPDLTRMNTDYDRFDQTDDFFYDSDDDEYGYAHSDYYDSDPDEFNFGGDLWNAADEYGMECLHLDDQKELLYAGYGGWGDSDDPDSDLY